LYLSRSGNSRRALENSLEIEAYFLKNNFEIVSPERLSIAEQAKLFQDAQFIAGPSGGAFANIVFCNPTTTVVNFFHWQADDTFFRLSNALSLDYGYVSSRPTGNPHFTSAKGITQDYRIEIADIHKTLELTQRIKSEKDELHGLRNLR
jgi:capsular polysaccharide biosynthesis protein